jgi:hypothetical protein
MGLQLARSRAGGFERVISLEISIVGQQRPNNSGVLVGKRHGRHIGIASLYQLVQPTACVDFLLGSKYRRFRAVDQQSSKVGIPSFADTQQGGLAPA